MYQPKKDAGTKVNRIFMGVTKKCTKMIIEGEEYRICREASGDYWANEKPGIRGRGLCATKKDPRKPVRTGLLGQMAFAKLTGTEFDNERREGGDRYDALIGEQTVDVKCATYDYGCNCLMCRSERGKEFPVDKDFYIQSYMESEYPDEERAVIIVVGYMTQDDVHTKAQVERGRGGQRLHYNYELRYDHARDIDELVQLAENVSV